MSKKKTKKKLEVKAEKLRKLQSPDLDAAAGAGGSLACPSVGCTGLTVDPFKTFTCVTYTTR